MAFFDLLGLVEPPDLKVAPSLVSRVVSLFVSDISSQIAGIFRHQRQADVPHGLPDFAFLDCTPRGF